MRFSDGRVGSREFSLSEAAMAGYAPNGGILTPLGDTDLRLLVYGPELSFSETAGLAAATLFPEDLDPTSALELAALAFPSTPPTIHLGEDLFGIDLTGGLSGRAQDYASRFIATFLSKRIDGRGIVGLAALGSGELEALDTAFGASGLPIIGLCDETGLHGLDPASLARNGGSLILVGLRGGMGVARRLEREAFRSQVDGLTLLPLGGATPLRFAGEALLLASIFMAARRGIAGELYLLLPPHDPDFMATALWVWSWGLPFTGLILPVVGDKAGEGKVSEVEAESTELYEAFTREHPSASLLLRVPVSKADLERQATSPSPWDSALDDSSLLTLTAARNAFDSGLGGHSRIIVPRYTRAPRVATPPQGFPPSTEPDFIIEPRITDLREILMRSRPS